MDGRHFLIVAILGTCSAGCVSGPTENAAPSAAPQSTAPRFTQTGLASFYGPHLMHRRTAAGERFDPGALTAAHRTLPFGTTVRVTNLANRHAVIVRITDRGPYKRDRIVDLSERAATELGMKKDGLASVRLDVVDANERQAFRSE